MLITDEAIGSAFRQFRWEEAFGGRGQRASAQEETEEKVERKVLTEGEFRTEVVDMLDAIEERLRHQWLEAARLAKATELQNFLLQQLLVALGGSAPAFGKLPAEGKWGTEDEVEESYKLDESEEGSDKESVQRKSESEWSSPL